MDKILMNFGILTTWFVEFLIKIIPLLKYETPLTLTLTPTLSNYVSFFELFFKLLRLVHFKFGVNCF